MQQFAPFLSLGAQLAVSVLVSAALGWWIDTRYATEPIGIIAGVMLGSVVGLTHFLRTVIRLTTAQQRDTTQER